MNPNPRIPYRFSGQGVDLKPHAKGRILVHLVVNVEHWVFDAAMPRTLITPPHGKKRFPMCQISRGQSTACAVACLAS